MIDRVRNRHFLIIDLFLIPLAVYLSFVLRMEAWHLNPKLLQGLFVFLLATTVITPVVFKRFGIYARYWLFASLDELMLLGGSVLTAALIAYLISLITTYFLVPEAIIPRSVPVIFVLLALLVTALPRLGLRLVRRQRRRWLRPTIGHKVLIAGAGMAGAMVAREMLENPHLGLFPVGFVDDDESKHHMRVHGLLVHGDRSAIPALVQEHKIQQMIIAMPTAPGKEIREILQICKQAKVDTKTIPGVFELLNGKVQVSQLRNVEIEDLLRREPVQTDIAAIRELIAGKRVLITGGGGSIGSELCRQVWECRPAELALVGHGENSIFGIHGELRQRADAQKNYGTVITAYIADVRFPERLNTIFREVRPEIVFHTAAHKHVPLMEMNPTEAIENNVIGTRNLLDVSLRTGVQNFVMISTDKAVNPTSIMGVSKRVAEILVHQAALKSGRPYVAVRFGNVLGSRGSVVLTFKQQIAMGGPVTVTHPEMTRYFMTIPEAVQLVLQAAVLGKGGETFVLDMGDPVKIVDLARDLIRLSGLEEGRDIDIVFSGIRPGEKLFEELFAPWETYQRTRHHKIFFSGNEQTPIGPDLDAMIHFLEVAARMNDRAAIERGFQNIVPEYQPSRYKQAPPKETTAAVDLSTPSPPLQYALNRSS